VRIIFPFLLPIFWFNENIRNSAAAMQEISEKGKTLCKKITYLKMPLLYY
jgi:hypothetical protein